MKEVKNITERRSFLKYALGVGTTIWLTPTIITLSAKKGHACLSGGRNWNKSDNFDGGGSSWNNWWNNWNGGGGRGRRGRRCK
jgi:hypothetical protein